MRLPISFCLAPLLLAFCAPAQKAATARFSLTAGEVATALAASGVQMDPRDITLPANLTSTSISPTLHIAGAEAASAEHVRLRIICAPLKECLPFYVLLGFRRPEMADEVISQLALKSARKQPTSTSGETMLHAGAPAVLLLETDRMRIRIPVISIDSGSPGTAVRVASLDRKQLYHGIVSDGATVRGTIP